MNDTQQPVGSSWIASVLAEYEAPLAAYARRLTGEAESARDVVQEAFLRLCREKRASVDGHVRQWLFTVCRRCAVDKRRKDRRMSFVGDSPLQAVQTPFGGPPARLEADESAGQVTRLMAALPSNQQEVICLRFQGGLSYREIAAVTGLSVGNVGFLIHTAIKTLREGLAAAGVQGQSPAANDAMGRPTAGD